MKLRLGEEQQRAAFEQVRIASGPSWTYFILTILSTVISSYGLISDSTATVIGAMIVAPLMGPILGLAMGTVRDDPRLAASSLLAEVAGVALCLTTAACVALLVSPSAIDFANREISARLHPTLYDMAVGFAAGLAGAYDTLNHRISASIAGVAIAVALVPPLAVSGLCAVGALKGGLPLWEAALNAFLLFFANFLTIEVASVSVFYLGGLHMVEGRLNLRAVMKHVIVMIVLIGAVGAFLSHQLNGLLRERLLTTQVRAIIKKELAQIPGASIDHLVVTPTLDMLEIHLGALSPQEISSSMVRQIQDDISRELNLATRLTVRTVSSVYVTADGKLFEPTVNDTPDPRAMRAQAIERALRAAIEAFPEAEMVNFRQRSAGGQDQLFVTVRSPFIFDPPRVQVLQARTNEALERMHIPTCTLVVRSILSRDATSSSYLDPVPPGRTPAEAAESTLQLQVRAMLQDIATTVEGATIIECSAAEEPLTPLTWWQDANVRGAPTTAAAESQVRVVAVVQAPRLMGQEVVTNWQGALRSALGRPVVLTLTCRVGTTLTGTPP